MAVRRMISKSVIETDNFFDMNTKAQLVYFYLNLEADDDGFIGNLNKLLRTLGATQKQLGELVENGYVIMFDTGVAVISHWRAHNSIRKDRYTQTVYRKEFDSLVLDDKNVYHLATEGENSDTPAVDKAATQVRLGKVSSAKVNKRESEERKGCRGGYHPPAEAPTPTPRGEMGNVMLTEEEYQRLKTKCSDADRLIDRLSLYLASTGKKYNSHYATLVRWAKDDTEQGINKKAPPPQKESEDSFDFDEFFAAAVRRGQNLFPKEDSEKERTPE